MKAPMTIMLLLIAISSLTARAQPRGQWHNHEDRYYEDYRDVVNAHILTDGKFMEWQWRDTGGGSFLTERSLVLRQGSPRPHHNPGRSAPTLEEYQAEQEMIEIGSSLFYDDKEIITGEKGIELFRALFNMYSFGPFMFSACSFQPEWDIEVTLYQNETWHLQVDFNCQTMRLHTESRSYFLSMSEETENSLEKLLVPYRKHHLDRFERYDEKVLNTDPNKEGAESIRQLRETTDRIKRHSAKLHNRRAPMGGYRKSGDRYEDFLRLSSENRWRKGDISVILRQASLTRGRPSSSDEKYQKAVAYDNAQGTEKIGGSDFYANAKLIDGEEGRELFNMLLTQYNFTPKRSHLCGFQADWAVELKLLEGGSKIDWDFLICLGCGEMRLISPYRDFYIGMSDGFKTKLRKMLAPYRSHHVGLLNERDQWADAQLEEQKAKSARHLLEIFMERDGPEAWSAFEKLMTQEDDLNQELRRRMREEEENEAP